LNQSINSFSVLSKFKEFFTNHLEPKTDGTRLNLDQYEDIFHYFPNPCPIMMKSCHKEFKTRSEIELIDSETNWFYVDAIICVMKMTIIDCEASSFHIDAIICVIKMTMTVYSRWLLISN
jgi:hypothetical protein